MRQGGTTVFITTHYLDEADSLCDRLAIIDHGEIVAQDTPDALKRQISWDIVTLGLEGASAVDRAQMILRDQPFVREIEAVEGETSGGGLRLYVENGEQALPSILRSLDDAGLEVREISLSRPTLDDVFLKLTGRSLREAEEAGATEGQSAPAA